MVSRTAKLGELLQEVDIRAGTEYADLPVLSLTKNFGLIPQTKRFKHRVATEDVSRYKVVSENQVVHNPYVLWEGAIHALRHGSGIVSPVYPVWAVTKLADPRFVDYLLRTPAVMGEYERRAKGTVKRRRSVAKAEFLDIDVLVPPLPDQQRIANILSTIEEACLSRHEAMAARLSLLVALREESFARMSNLTPLAAVVDSVKYGTSVACIDGGPGPQVLGIRNIGEIIIDNNGAKRLPTVPADSDGNWLQDGDLLFVRTNADQRRIGRCAVYSGPSRHAMFASYLLRARIDQSVANPWFLAHYAASMQGREELRASGTGAADGKFNLNGPSLRAWRFPMVPLSEQEALVQRLEVLRVAVEAERRSLRAAEKVLAAAGDCLFESIE